MATFRMIAVRVSIIALAVVVGCFIVLAVLLFVLSPGRPRPVLGADGKPVPGSISEKIFVDIDGARQGMFIRGADPGSPVLLYLHGGTPDYFLTGRYPTGLEDIFTVCYWEQRGSGLSYRSNAPADSVTAERLISDTIEITRYLLSRVRVDRVYLMGHSGGTFIGIQAAARAPELYHAYIGAAQMAKQLRSEQTTYGYMLETYRTADDRSMVRKLEAAPLTESTGTLPRYLAVRDTAMHSLGIGTTRDMHSVAAGIFLESLGSPDYTVAEKLNMWHGKAHGGVNVLWQTMLSTDLGTTLTELQVPAYFLHGIHDYTCCYTVAKDYSAKLRAPVKGFYTFSESAHSPIFEEPEKVRKIIREDILSGRVSLAERT